MSSNASLGRASVLLLAVCAGVTGTAFRRATEQIQTADNTRPAGTLRDGVLTLRLDTRVGLWRPDGDGAPSASVQAFAEGGRAPQVPGPLIRVPSGTEVVVMVTNSIPDSVLTLHGLVSRPLSAGAPDSVQVAPGTTREVHFRVDAPGTYFYWGTTTGRSFFARTGEDAQLSGAIVVDEPGVTPRPDRILVIGQWADTTPSEANPDVFQRRLLLVVNGRSWPHTERFSYAVGDSVRWRVINASANVHPMHLHGFYFRVDSRGDGTGDTTYAEERRDHVVTERMAYRQTMRITWVPERPGNWLFHCHFTSHFARRDPLGIRLDDPARVSPARHVHNHALEGMSGLVLGVTVRPGRITSLPPAPDVARRRLRLLIRPSVGGTERAPIYTFALHEGGAEPPLDSGVRAGPPLVLTRDVPVAIEVVNRTPEPTAIHWHGIELESYFDGVAGFSGGAQRMSPLIAAGDSFEVRFTPPRSGTFIYHTHVDELRQQPAGMSGAIIVLEPGQRYDPATDIAVLITTPRDSADQRRTVLLNGRLTPAPVDVRVGVPHRLRFINITIGRPSMRVELRRDTTLLTWRALAKDGGELPAARQGTRTARQLISIGETYDFELTPDAVGEYRLEVRTGTGVLIAVMPLRATEAGKPGGP
ncbi:MAG TPA: multicopper oxidase domain-containing protein [Gemmatimonadales bacterium]|nr:multicopper oxidase domain-containing protein [Gemmatimonadales bacterium]